MTTGPGRHLLNQLRRTLGAPALAGLPDGPLLHRFAAGGGDALPAFDLLLRRHGPLVWRACRAALRDEHAAEDAFQATFLLLVRKASRLSLRGSLGPWLFGVALRVCAHARRDAARRQAHERRAAEARAAAPCGLGDAVAELVHDEVARLPKGLRSAVVLCDLEGLTYQEAAERLGWTHAAVRGRLARARERLRQRLARHGLGPSLLVAAPPVPRPLAAATARGAFAFASGQPAGVVPDAVLLLVNGGLQSMLVTKIKSLGLTTLAGAVLVAGALGLGAQQPPPARTVVVEPEEAQDPTAARFAFRQVADAELISRLAREAQKLQEAGDAEGALKKLRELDEAAWAWQGRVRQQRDHRPAAAKDAPAEGAYYLYRGQINAKPAPAEAKSAPPTGYRPAQPAAEPKPAMGPTAIYQPAQAANAPAKVPAPGGRSDVEERLNELERKIDRLIKTLSESRDREASPDASPGTPRRR